MLLLLLFASPFALVLTMDPSLRRVFSNSRAFSTHHPHPISRTTTLEYLFRSKHVKESDVQKYIQSARIVVHPTVRQIAIDFLAHKRTHGTKTEKNVYAEQIEWDVERFFARLIRQRPLSFYGKGDTTLLRNHKHLISATSAWDRVGSDNEHHDIPMEYYLTYEEMMVLSLIGVSGYTPYLNDGNRYNRGVAGTPEPTQPEGVHIGLVGARFERRGRMDSVYAGDPEFGSFPFASYFPGEHFESRYKARIRITVETLLLEAEQRRLEAHKRVYVHVVGLGLGVWVVHRDQPRWYVEVFTRCLAELKLKWIGVLEFVR
jgi:hypothetical protein